MLNIRLVVDHFFFPLGMLTVFSQASDFKSLLQSSLIFDTLWKMCSCVSLPKLVCLGILPCVCVSVMEAAVNETFIEVKYCERPFPDL